MTRIRKALFPSRLTNSAFDLVFVPLIQSNDRYSIFIWFRSVLTFASPGGHWDHVPRHWNLQFFAFHVFFVRRLGSHWFYVDQTAFYGPGARVLRCSRGSKWQHCFERCRHDKEGFAVDVLVRRVTDLPQFCAVGKRKVTMGIIRHRFQWTGSSPEVTFRFRSRQHRMYRL